MRYLSPQFIHLIWLTLRQAHVERAEGQTFDPVRPIEEVAPKIDAAANRPRQAFEGHQAHSTFFEKVAALTHAISAGHCFGNGNKRTAFLTMNFMLSANGWHLDMPPEVIAFVMLRSASNNNGMTIAELADCIAAFSFLPSSKVEARTLLHKSEELVRVQLLEVEEPDVFPATHPVGDRKPFVDRMLETLKRHQELADEVERQQLLETFGWPIKLTKTIARWGHMNVYRAEVQRKLTRRRKTKRCGKRRCPQKGGRTIPKLSRPIRQWNLPRPRPKKQFMGEPT